MSSAPGGTGTLVARPRHDFGHVTQGATLKHAFVAHNGTPTALTLEDSLEVLGCSAVAVPGVLEQGEDGKWEVTCHATVHGPLRVSLPLRANGRPAGELSLVAEVEPLLVFDRAVVSVTLPFGDHRREAAHLRGKLARRARLTPAAAPPPGLEVSVLSGDDTQGEGVAVRVTGKAVGTHVGSLRFATGLPEPKEVSLSYVVKVTGTLEVSPTNPVLDLALPGPKRTLVKVTSSQPDFRVERAEVLEGPFTARVRRTDSGFELELGVVEARLPAGSHGVNGRVRIVSNDRTEPAKELPLFALGRPPVAAQRP